MRTNRGNPREADVSRTATQGRHDTNGNLLITFNRRTDDPTLRITVEKTDNLLAGSWTTTGIEVLGTPEDILENGTKVGERVTCRILPFAPPTDPPRIFARLRIHR